MAKQTINIGSAELAGDGESIRTAFDKVNDNFNELYADVSTLDGSKIVYGDLSVSTASASGAGSLTYNSSTGVFTFTPAASVAETNDLTAAVTWTNIPDAYVPESAVTQHQAALTITESQISDLSHTAEVNDLTSAVTWANVPDANITESSVTQHEAALTITESQISDLQSYLTSGGDVSFTSVQLTGGSGDEGTLTWNDSDRTLDLDQGGVTLQLGQETHFMIRNATGSTIANGTFLGFTGVTVGSNRITAGPFDASTMGEHQLVGFATESISNGVNGLATTFGYVRGLDTRGTIASSLAVGDEDWAVSDILYPHPTVPGKLTNVEPTTGFKAKVAVITNRHQSAGEIFVRITPHNERFDEYASTAYGWGDHSSAGYLTSETFTSLVQDTTPQLGGNLELNNSNITGTGDISITGTATFTDAAWSEFILHETNNNTAGRFIALSGNVYVQAGASGSGKASSSGNLIFTGYNNENLNSLQAKFGGSNVDIATTSTTQTFTNKSGNISQWTNDSGYIESDTTGITGADQVTNIVTLTQAEYDAIGTPNASTVYIIVG